MLNKRILSLLLAIVLVVGLMPTSVFATETGGTTAPTESVPETNGEAIVPQNDEEPVPCDICNVADCGVEHKYCEKCEKYDCGKAHVICEVCKVEDCGVEHEQCDLCGAYDCDGNDVFCDTCNAWNCGKLHNITCETCGKVDCEGHDVTIPTIPTLPTEPEGEEETEPKHDEDCSDECEAEDCECECHVTTLLQKLLEAETPEEMDILFDEASDEEIFALTEEDYEEINAHLQSLMPPRASAIVLEESEPPVQSEIVTVAVNYDNVAPFVGAEN